MFQTLGVNHETQAQVHRNGTNGANGPHPAAPAAATPTPAPAPAPATAPPTANETSLLSLTVALKWPDEDRTELAALQVAGKQVLAPTIANACATFNVKRSAVMAVLRRAGYFAANPIDRAFERASAAEQHAFVDGKVMKLWQIMTG